MLRSLVLSLALSVFGALPTAAQTTAGATTPDVTFGYSALFDATCARLGQQEADSTAAHELDALLPELEARWEEDGPRLFAEVVAVVGVPFQFRETRAALFLCRGVPSMAFPLLVNARPYVAATAGGSPQPVSVFTNTLFHEVLHRYIRDIVGPADEARTPLLEKYAGERPVIRNHLHLAAIETEVYRRLGRDQELAAVIAYEGTLRSAWAFERVREIVADEGASAFIEELTPG